MFHTLFRRKMSPRISTPAEEIHFVKEPTLDTDPTTDRIYQFIREEGYVPFKRSDSLVVFKIQGESFGATWSEKHHWAAVRIWFDLKDEDMIPAMIAAHAMMAKWAIIRIYVDEDDHDVTFSVEQFCDSMDEYRSFFRRALDIVNTNMNLFGEALDEARSRRNEKACRFISSQSPIPS